MQMLRISFFFSKSAVNPSYCLLCVDLFSSKVYVNPMKKRYFLAKELALFYEEIEPKRNMNEEMMLQTNLGFQQRKIMKLNEKYNVLTFSTKIRGLKAFAAEQKIREFKKLLSKSKGLQKSISSQRLEPKEVIQRAVDNTNKVASQKNGFSPDFEEEKTLNDENV